VNTPRTDKFYDEVSDRESPDNGQKGWALPSKWSYEAIIDVVDFARKLEVENAELLKSLQDLLAFASWERGRDVPTQVIAARAAIKKAT
jgi:hypothetical protein